MENYQANTLEFVEGQQSKGLHALIDVEPGCKVKVEIKRDTYDFQSSAVAYLWTNGSWERLASTHYSQMLTVKREDYYKAVDNGDLMDEMHALMKKVVWTLGVADGT